ncbi:FIST N-terminal domain-containing protein [Sorangium sp. So ce296]|uniref:FIST signal transduction protein n=1 Tax=Sorangium sp. So ce296 TaxID=3133296 RepID=UPI003F614469
MSNNDVDSGTNALSGANDALQAGRAGAEGAAGAAGTMKMASASSTAGSTGVAFAEALAALRAGLGGEPDHLFLSYTEGHDLGELARATAALPPSVRVHGSSSCLSVMTAAGVHGAPGAGLALFGIADARGAYGAAAEPIGESPRAAAARAARRAMEDADRAGKPPALFWLTAPLGVEEQVLCGIEDAVGADVPVFGGTSAANSLDGALSQLGRGQAHRDAVLLSALYPSGEIAYAFGSGYTPTEHRGWVTRSEGRRVPEIDGQPAAEVYNRWTGGRFAAQLGGGSIAAESALSPLGRPSGWAGKAPRFLLIHPNAVDQDNALTFGVHISEGDELVLMKGSREGLLDRITAVAGAALEVARPSFQPQGALVIFCAGCMLAVRDDIDRVVQGMSAALGPTPFLGSFTFGEQGCFVRGKNQHANLSIAVVLFGQSA